MYVVKMRYTPKVQRIWNYKERHDNAITSKACVAVILHERLVCLERQGSPQHRKIT